MQAETRKKIGIFFPAVNFHLQELSHCYFKRFFPYNPACRIDGKVDNSISFDMWLDVIACANNNFWESANAFATICAFALLKEIGSAAVITRWLGLNTETKGCYLSLAVNY